MVSESYLFKRKYYFRIGRNMHTDCKATLLLQLPVYTAEKLVGWEVYGPVATTSVLPLLPQKPRYPKYCEFTLRFSYILVPIYQTTPRYIKKRAVLLIFSLML
jgi:hypothetical protein